MAKKKFRDNSLEAQRNRLLDVLMTRASISTVEARRDLDIMMPGTRIYELRHRHGLEIEKVWSVEETEAGNPHRVARYFLKK